MISMLVMEDKMHSLPFLQKHYKKYIWTHYTAATYKISHIKIYFPRSLSYFLLTLTQQKITIKHKEGILDKKL